MTGDDITELVDFREQSNGSLMPVPKTGLTIEQRDKIIDGAFAMARTGLLHPRHALRLLVYPQRDPITGEFVEAMIPLDLEERTLLFMRFEERYNPHEWPFRD